ncbi:MAG: hypothetical protein EON54_03120 [Alcaligenaceae bacterium]|nr:MAG: hypothetical protein EON54_03120 [Alcaligenaceae bacterium]
MWILHQQTLSPPQERPLPRDIAEFYPVALNTISRATGLRGAKQRDLRLLYFKGLIVAHTHPKQQMVDAIKHADNLLDQATEPGTELVVHSSRSDLVSGDQDTLEHIAGALSGPAGSSH